MIRAHPPGAPPAEYAVFGASVDVLETIEVVLGQVTALRAAAVHAVAEDTPAGVVADQVVDVLMMALNRSRRSGLYLREQALMLTHQPQVWAALWAGHLDVTKAGILARALYQVPRQDVHDRERPEYATDCQRLLAAGMAYATEHTAGQLDRHLKRLLAEIDPATIVTRRRRALAERGVWIDHRGDGTADLSARLDSTDAEQVYAAIRAVALATQRTDTAAAAGDSDACGDAGRDVPAEAARRPFDLRMADALIDLILTPGTGTRTGTGIVTRTGTGIGGEPGAVTDDAPDPTVQGSGSAPGSGTRYRTRSGRRAGRHPDQRDHPDRQPRRAVRHPRDPVRVRGPARGPGPPPGRKRHPLAPHPHRPGHRRHPRRRHLVLPTPHRPGPPRAHPRRHLPIPRLHRPRPRMRPRPPDPIPRRAQPARTTSTPCADGTTGSSTTTTGQSNPSPTPACAGPAPWAPPATPGPTPTTHTRSSPTPPDRQHSTCPARPANSAAARWIPRARISTSPAWSASPVTPMFSVPS